MLTAARSYRAHLSRQNRVDDDGGGAGGEQQQQAYSVNKNEKVIRSFPVQNSLLSFLPSKLRSHVTTKSATE